MASPARHLVSNSAPPPRMVGPVRQLVSIPFASSCPIPFASSCPIRPPPPMAYPARQLVPNTAPPHITSSGRPPTAATAIQGVAPPPPRSLPYHDYVRDHPTSSVPDSAGDWSVDAMAKWNHHAWMEMQHEATRQMEIMLEARKIDQQMEMLHNKQSTRSSSFSYGRRRSSSRAHSHSSLPYGGPVASISRKPLRRSNVSLPARSHYSNSSIGSLQLDRMVVKPPDNPAEVLASGSQGCSSGRQAFAVDARGAEMGTMANLPDSDETSNVPDRYIHPGPHASTNVVNEFDDTTGGFSDATNGRVHAMDGQADTRNGFVERDTTNGHVSDGRVTGGDAHTINGQINDGGVNAANGYVDRTAPHMNGSALAGYGGGNAMAGYGDGNTVGYGDGNATEEYGDGNATTAFDNSSAMPGHGDGNTMTAYGDGNDTGYGDGNATEGYGDGNDMAEYSDSNDMAYSDGDAFAYSDGSAMAYNDGNAMAYNGGNAMAYNDGNAGAGYGGNAMAYNDGNAGAGYRDDSATTSWTYDYADRTAIPANTVPMNVSSTGAELATTYEN
uniref:Glycylpeptide N-tetradecanoyltransferase (NMT) (Peptide N-myristoyltransferase)) n=1 Tax=Ganoderma boninense TaxID=34458 RepID=A0A5K1JZ40_9APHY|nr:Glycylpeptide N-tetradecanoyltransferase (EC (Myristoyl-CoA:protein N-myristoyltransferase) (NMT) (Peptide N-myristoyltransferase) [Ganoderma boninense]